ncbi:MAG TPA: NADH:ubiquinone reductase (Na(+)-transporting) subunit B [Candidatus Hydrogenedens sp.]|nr:NADH:ubiquinone reductase (Na(+)-transporting) subunit B [Candidatus Hydrogenedens sp.]
MKWLRNILDHQGKMFEPGGKLAWLYPLWEANDTFLYTPGTVTKGAPHVRDAIDLKRLMITVVVALIPCVIMALYNTGLQAFLGIESMGLSPEQVPGWRAAIFRALGLGFNPGNIISCILYGALYFFPVYIVTLACGGICEVIFAIVRKHEISEGFLVTSLLFPLILPPQIPLWQVAIGIIFGVVIGKEIFGGVGMNILNPALTARAFLYFAYPAQISGDKVWVAVDGYSGATSLAIMKEKGVEALQSAGVFSINLHDGVTSWLESLIGLEPGSMGETSVIACLIGALILIYTGVGSWRTIAGVFLGSGIMALLLSFYHSPTNPAFQAGPLWHWVIGGLAFGGVFMATDPVSSPFTDTGRWIYGLFIGSFVVLLRTVNPAYPEVTMLVILFANIFAPLTDYFVMQSNIKRRLTRHAA